MIETAHGVDRQTGLPVYSLYSETREPTETHAEGRRRHRGRPPGRRLPHLHVRVHDGQLHARGARAGQAGGRVRPPQPDRRGSGGRERPRPGVRLVRRPLPDPDAPRHDLRRAGPAVQRGPRHRLRPRGGADGGLGARDVDGRHGRAVGHALAQHADPRHRRRLSGHRAPRGHADVGGARHHAAFRAGRRALHRRRGLRRSARTALGLPGVYFRADRLPADLPEARRPELRRRADPRARPRARSSR